MISNPARQVRHKREAIGRLRFLTRKEYDSLCGVIRERFPVRQYRDEVVGTVLAHMGQVHLDRRTIDLTKTKNGSAPTRTPERRLYCRDPIHPAEGTKDQRPSLPSGRLTFRYTFLVCAVSCGRGIDGYVWHSNQHTFCSWLAMAGATIKEIQ